MKKIAISVLLAIPAIAYCQQESAVGVAFERYSVLIGAVHVNGNCKFLSESETKEFGRDLGLISMSLMTALGDASRLSSITMSAKKVADSDNYKSCGDAARTVVAFGRAASRAWSSEIREAVFGGATRIQSMSPPSAQQK